MEDQPRRHPREIPPTGYKGPRAQSKNQIKWRKRKSERLFSPFKCRNSGKDRPVRATSTRNGAGRRETAKEGRAKGESNGGQTVCSSDGRKAKLQRKWRRTWRTGGLARRLLATHKIRPFGLDEPGLIISILFKPIASELVC